MVPSQSTRKSSMSTLVNEFQQAIGIPVPGWTTRPYPERITLQGRYCRLEPLDADRHAADLYQAYAQAPDDRDWTYMMYGPFRDAASYYAHAASAAKSEDPLHFAVIDLRSGRALGTLSLMTIGTVHGSIEVGHVTFSPSLRRTPASTEAQFLLMRHAFETLGYRRYEWKCHSLNGPSRQAALRLGFQFEGIMRQARVYKGNSRDTAWFSILDSEWPELRTALLQWLAPENMLADGKQRQSLADIRARCAK